ncbi:MAG: efflux transporter outer membrane subunit [Legionella sp.]|jgi:NodT family efflux transporter outer membrane factor (OMF) lipoprotein
MKKWCIAGLISVLLGCNMAPKYQTPPMPLPKDFKNPGKWVKVSKQKRVIKPDNWWQAFHDPVLNDLEIKLTLANQDLQIAYARFQEAAALAQAARANFFPNIQGLFNADRQQTSMTLAKPVTPALFNQFLVGSYLSYELDVWGHILNSYRVSKHEAQASAVDVAGAYLSLHAELANDYFALRGYDEQQRVLDKTVTAYKKALYITQKRYKGGASPIADVDEAQTQLQNAKTMAEDMRLQRAQVENAIAVLVGEVASNFAIAPGYLPKEHLSVTPIIPSTLVQRRPDIVAAELRVQAANANIGVARAAFFPVIELTGALGFQSHSMGNLLTQPSLFWSLGPFSILTLTQPIAQMTLFDGGKLIALLRKANADYYETVAAYRQTVLTAFKEVEDNLIAIKQLDKEQTTQSAATSAAKRAWAQEQYRYSGGLVTFLQVVVVENAALQSELALINVRTRRQIASVGLIRAVGGGWLSPMA